MEVYRDCANKGEKEKSVIQMLQEISEDICNNYCRYRNPANEDCLCDVIRDGEECPLDKLN